MVQRKLPFENRWSSDAHAWQWHCALERIGTENVRMMFVDHERHRPNDRRVVGDVPPQFVSDWLAYRDRHAAHLELRWRVGVIVLVLIGAVASLYTALH